MMHGTIIRKGRWLIQEWDTEWYERNNPTIDYLLRMYRAGKGRMIDNTITNVGLVEMSKRNLGLSTSANNKMLLGRLATPTPMASQTALAGQTGSVNITSCLLYTSPSPRDRQKSRMPSSA